MIKCAFIRKVGVYDKAVTVRGKIFLEVRELLFVVLEATDIFWASTRHDDSFTDRTQARCWSLHMRILQRLELLSINVTISECKQQG